MQERSVRRSISALLLVSVPITGFFLFTIEQRTSRAVEFASDTTAQLARVSETLSNIGTAQQGYVAPGQLDEPWFERASGLTADLAQQLQQVRARVQSPAAPALLQQLTASVATLTATDARTRENLRLGQELMASDVIFSDGRNLLDAMTASLRDLQAAEQSHLRGQLTNLARLRWLTLGGSSLLWIAGLVILARAKRPKAVTGTTMDTPAATAERLVETSQPRIGIDLAAAANVCTDLSRITTTAALPGLLGRAAGVLNASGLILWISAGEQLFPVMAHGYSDDTLARMAPIARSAENAAADAWRTGQLTVVPAATSGGRGAIVTPLFGLHNCIGVLSAELRHGEDSPAVQAVATIIAAQLSTVVPAWPAGTSLTPSENKPASQARSA